jgi:hypothetical protein
MTMEEARRYFYKLKSKHWPEQFNKSGARLPLKHDDDYGRLVVFGVETTASGKLATFEVPLDDVPTLLEARVIEAVGLVREHQAGKQ